MAKPTNIASTAHAQHLEMQAAFGGVATQDTVSLTKQIDELQSEVENLTGVLADQKAAYATLLAEFEAEKTAHAETQAALDAASAPPAQQ